MTHSLHRRGTPESLKNDYVLLVTAATNINHQGAKEKLLKVLDIVWDIGPANIGSYDAGTILAGYSIADIKAALNEVPRVRCSFSSQAKIREAVRRIRELDLGLSVTVEGPTLDIVAMCRDMGIKPHSVNLSLDIWGKRQALPPEDVLELTTMCGHGLISPYLAANVIHEVRAGKRTPREAAALIGRPCVCGIFNPDRAAALLAKYLPQRQKGEKLE